MSDHVCDEPRSERAKATVLSDSEYQLLPPLPPEVFAALKDDIALNGVLIAVEIDEEGRILDGHHRHRAVTELRAEGHEVDLPTKTRTFASEEEKRIHILKLNLIRRQLDPVTWAERFVTVLNERGVKRGRGARNDRGTSESVAQVAAELGVSERTARNRLSLLDQPEDVKERVRRGEISANDARRAVADQDDGDGAATADPPPLMARPSGTKANHGAPLPWTEVAKLTSIQQENLVARRLEENAEEYKRSLHFARDMEWSVKGRRYRLVEILESLCHDASLLVDYLRGLDE